MISPALIAAALQIANQIFEAAAAAKRGGATAEQVALLHSVTESKVQLAKTALGTTPQPEPDTPRERDES